MSAPTCSECGAALLFVGAPCPSCTARPGDQTVLTPAVPDADEELGLIRGALGDEYEIVEELGRGGMAVVYRARERALERDVAIKVLPVVRTFDAELVERFQREARLSASLEHPHIIPIYRVGQTGRVSFIVMKYVQGASLADRLEREGALAPPYVEEVLLQVADALDHAHGRGIVHRDVKPDNIMEDQPGRWLVMDFGIAKPVGGERLTQTGGSMGTPRYMSPEQAKAGELDGRSDLYSLGVVAYHCLVGHPPFQGEDALAVMYAHLHDSVPEPELASGDARRVYAVVRGLLAKSPDDRIQDGAELRAALAGSPARAGVIAQPPAAAPTSTERVGGATVPRAITSWIRGRPRRFRVAAGGGAAILVAVSFLDGATAQCREAIPDASDGDRALLVDPLDTVVQGDDIEISYVACGLPDDEPFSARLTIRPSDSGGVVGRVGRFFGGGDDPVRLTWDDRSDGFATSRRRTIVPPELEPGGYRVTLRVEGGDGRDAEASHDFTVVDP